MLRISDVEDWISQNIQGSDFFVVAVNQPQSDELLLEVDRDGGITSDECGEICRALSGWLDEQGLDFTVTVSSPGLTTPLRVPRQFMKNLGASVEVLETGGIKRTGVLQGASETGFSVEVTEMVREPGAKRPKPVTRVMEWEYSGVKQVKLIVGKR